jgi:hypothetical protein
VVFAPLAYLPLKAQLTGPARVQADITQEVRGSSDLLAVVTPSRRLAIAPDAAVRRGDQFAGSREAYLGIPLLLVVAALLVLHRSPVVGVGATMLVVSMVLSLGSRLRVGGHPTPVRLPWIAIESLPLLWNMVPARFALFTAMFAGLLLAVAVDGLWWGGGRLRRSLAVATALVVLAFLVPAAPLRPSPVVATPPFFTTSALTRLPRDQVALVVPFPRKGRANQAMRWQADAGMWFKMPGGYFAGQGADGAAVREAPPSTTSLALNRIERGGRPPRLTPALREQLAQDFARWRVRSVVLGPMPHRQVVAVRQRGRTEAERDPDDQLLCPRRLAHRDRRGRHRAGRVHRGAGGPGVEHRGGRWRHGRARPAGRGAGAGRADLPPAGRGPEAAGRLPARAPRRAVRAVGTDRGHH